jgi:hypoxanthine phosphoribosyltransferase
MVLGVRKKRSSTRPKLPTTGAILAVVISAFQCQNAFAPRTNYQRRTVIAAALGSLSSDGTWHGEPMSGATILRRTPVGRRRGRGDEYVLPVDVDDGPRQELLPPLKWQLQPAGKRFAHPAEVIFARLLTFYGIRWAYEPTTFAVRWASDGRPQEFVTPDFFLPDYQVYVELTTMRQRLVTRKNRKFRLLREQYPNISVRILYLRDFERLRETIGQGRAEREARIVGTLFEQHDVEARIAEVASHLAREWQGRILANDGRRPLLLGLGMGAEYFLASLGQSLRELGVAVDLDQIELTSIADEETDSRVRVSRSPVSSPHGRPVVIVQEVLSTGLSAAFLEAWLRRHGAISVEICALLDRRAARILDVPLTCHCFDAPDVPLAGFGLARWREYRDLPFIAEIAAS